MPKRMRKELNDNIKIEYTSNLLINSPSSCENQLLCFGCGHSLKNSKFILDVKGNNNHLYWHVDCLRCFECKEVLDESEKCFYKAGKIFCELHYDQLKICSGCKKEIENDEWILKAGLKKYHISCFNCNKCEKQLVTGEQFKIEFQDQKYQLICNMHFDSRKESTDGNESSSDDSISSNQTKNCNKTKRVRTTFTEEQLQILQTHFQLESNPDGQDLERIASRTGLSKRVTQVWFQNSRARQKKYMNKSRSTPPVIPTNLNSTSLNGTNSLLINCQPSSSNNNSTNINLHLLNSNTTSLPVENTKPVTANQHLQQQKSLNTTTTLFHSTSTNYSNPHLNSINSVNSVNSVNSGNSPYHDHSEISSPILMNNSFNNELNGNHLERLNGSLNSLSSNSSINSNSGSNSSCSNLILYNSNTANSKKLNQGNSSNGTNFTANRENINCNNVQWIEFQMKETTENREMNNLDTSINQLTSLNNLNSNSSFVPQLNNNWRINNLLDTNLCNTNTLLTRSNENNSIFEYSNHHHTFSSSS